MRQLTFTQAEQVIAMDRARTDGGLGCIYQDGAYLCRDVRDDSGYAEYHAILADSIAWLPPISPAQGRLALLQSDLLETVEAWIATQPRATQIEYESRTEWRRNWPLVIAAGAALELSEAQLDALFELAATL